MRTTARIAGAGLALVMLLVLLLGPEIAPYPAEARVGAPYAPPGTGWLLGTDHLGRDVLSRMLDGGRAMLLTSLVSAFAGAAAGALIGLFTALAAPGRKWVEPLLLRPLDVLASVPPILVLLLVLTAMPNRFGLVLAVVLTTAPLSARVLRAAGAQVVGRAHIEAAAVRGEGWWWLLTREVLPLVSGTVLADIGIRFVASVYLVASAGFLGIQAVGTDWGSLISDALPAAMLAPWTLLAPVLGVALLTVGANLFADSAGRRARRVLA